MMNDGHDRYKLYGRFIISIRLVNRRFQAKELASEEWPRRLRWQESVHLQSRGSRRGSPACVRQRSCSSLSRSRMTLLTLLRENTDSAKRNGVYHNIHRTVLACGGRSGLALVRIVDDEKARMVRNEHFLSGYPCVAPSVALQSTMSVALHAVLIIAEFHLRNARLGSSQYFQGPRAEAAEVCRFKKRSGCSDQSVL